MWLRWRGSTGQQTRVAIWRNGRRRAEYERWRSAPPPEPGPARKRSWRCEASRLGRQRWSEAGLARIPVTKTVQQWTYSKGSGPKGVCRGPFRVGSWLDILIGYPLFEIYSYPVLVPQKMSIPIFNWFIHYQALNLLTIEESKKVNLTLLLSVLPMSLI